MCAQEKVSNDSGATAEWQLLELSADDVRKHDDDEDTNSIAPAAEAVTSSSGLHHLQYTLTGLTANKSYAGRLRANNVFGSSHWSPQFSFRTAAERTYTCI